MLKVTEPQTITGQPILTKLPQALRSGFASRLRLDQTTLFISTAPVVRSNKRTATAISYAEIDEDYDEDDDNNGSTGMESMPGTPRASFNNNNSGSNNNLNNLNSMANTGTPSSPRINTSHLFQSSGAAPEKLETKALVNPNTVARVRHMLQYNDVQLREIADLDEVLVPIRLNLEHENFRISDFFLWNLNEKVLTPEMFAVALCQDLDLPIGVAQMNTSLPPKPASSLPSNLAASYASSPFVSQIASTINTQIHEYTTFANVKLPEEIGFHVVINLSVNLNKQVYEDKLEWDLGNGTRSSSYAHEGKLISGGPMKKISSDGSVSEVQEAEKNGGRASSVGRAARKSRSKSSSSPITVNLSNDQGDVVMEDEEEAEDGDSYSSNGPGFTPLEFARSVVQDLGLAGEFYPAIAHALYENLYRIKKEALEGHLPPQEVENYAAFGQEAGWRVDQEMLGEEWAPAVEVLSQEEIEKREIERERNIRRLKRESVRMGGAFDSYDDHGGRRKRTRRGESPAWY